MKKSMLILALTGAGVAAAVWWGGFRAGGKESAALAGVCTAHGLDPSRCPWCDPSLVEKLGTCGGHGVPEAFCWKCNAELIPAFKKLGDWCTGHDCPESLCKVCRGEAGDHSEHDGHDHGHDAAAPEGTPSMKSPGSLASTRLEQPPNVRCETGSDVVTLASTEVATRIGLETVLAEPRTLSEEILCNAEIAYDLNRFARLGSRAPGILLEVRADLGTPVRAGDVLAVVDSPELAQAKAEYVQALSSLRLAEQNRDREHELHERSGTPQKDLLEAEGRLVTGRMDLQKASLRLQAMGLDRAAAAALEASQDLSPRLDLLAPFDGVVVERSAVVGERIDASRTLFAVADTTRMWAMLDLNAVDAAHITVGRPVQVELDGLPEATRSARIAWISTEVDHRTRTLKARAELDNADTMLRANMFGHARVQVLDAKPLLTVPKTALQWDGCCNIVFVQRTDLQYEPRKVLLGYGTRDLVEIREGLAPGDRVVTTGSYLLKTEIMKSSIGAGCCPND